MMTIRNSSLIRCVFPRLFCFSFRCARNTIHYCLFISRNAKYKKKQKERKKEIQCNKMDGETRSMDEVESSKPHFSTVYEPLFLLILFNFLSLSSSTSSFHIMSFVFACVCIVSIVCLYNRNRFYFRFVDYVATVR